MFLVLRRRKRYTCCLIAPTASYIYICIYIHMYIYIYWYWVNSKRWESQNVYPSCVLCRRRRCTCCSTAPTASYIYICICVYIYICVCIYIYIYVCVCVCACVCVYWLNTNPNPSPVLCRRRPSTCFLTAPTASYIYIYMCVCVCVCVCRVSPKRLGVRVNPRRSMCCLAQEEALHVLLIAPTVRRCMYIYLYRG